MPDKAWKSFERRIAKRVGGRRIPSTGEKEGVDVDAGPFVYQAKLRRGMPSYLKDWLRGIVAAGERKGGSTGVVVWKAPNARDDDAVVVLRLRDWQDWHGVEDTGSEKPAGTESDGPLDFVHGVAGNGDDEHLDHSTSRPLRNPASLVSSNQTEIHNGNRTDQTRAI